MSNDRPPPPNPVALENEYVRVSRDQAPFAQASTTGSGDRVVVAMGALALKAGSTTKQLTRGQFAVFAPGESYELPTGAAYFEVAIKPDHPPVKSPSELIPPAKNMMMYEGTRFFIYEERLEPGDIRPRHSHCQRVEIRLNNGPMLDQWFDPPAPPMQPSIVNFRQPVVHTVRNIGDMPLRNLIIEFKPEPR
jgi:hypothetical protein